MNTRPFLQSCIAILTLVIAMNAAAQDGCLADINGDGIANGEDLGSVLGSWGLCAGCPADLNGNGLVNGEDLAIVLARWGLTCAPTVTAMTPDAGGLAGGVTVQITGDRLLHPTNVTFGGSPATILSSTRSTISVLAPSRPAGTCAVVVTTRGGSVGTGNFTYYAPPSITAVSPSTGAASGGNTVTINGDGFYGAPSVRFGTSSATGVTVDSPTRLTAITPSGTPGASVSVTVTSTYGSSSLANAFTYQDIPLPTIASLYANRGPVAGGTSFGIVGTGLGTATSVTVGGVACTVFQAADTLVTAVSPPGSAGGKPVSVVTPGGTATVSNGFTYYLTPTVTAVSPTAGPAGGGTTINITGTNLLGATEVTASWFVASFTVVNDTTIVAVTPQRTHGENSVVRVRTPGGYSSASFGPRFTYFGLPAVTSISPTAGPLSGGTSVTITGTNLTLPEWASTTALDIGGISWTPYTVTPTSIVAFTPAGSAGTKPIQITTPGGTCTVADGFSYVPPPTISAVTPSAGPMAGGTAITITGTNFYNGSSNLSFTIGGTPANSVSVISNTQATAVTPGGTPGAKTVAVVTPSGSANFPGGFNYIAVPTITGVSPAAGTAMGGSQITITGTNLTGSTAVTIDNAPATAVTVVSSTTVTAITPIGTPGSKTVSVTTPNGTATLPSAFTYIPVPTISTVAPGVGPVGGGTAITITGTNLTGTNSVMVGGSAANSITVVNPTTVTAVTPAGIAQAMTVYVTTPGGTTSLPNGFLYFGVPGITTVTPSTGSVSGGTVITITGFNLSGTTSVKVGGAAATSVTVVNDGKVTAVTPPCPGGWGLSYPVSITTPGGTATKPNAFTYPVP